MKVEYYLLGFLMRYGRQHGYSLKETLGHQVSDFAKIKLPTIYYNLEKLEKQGYVTAAIEKEGNRPEKTVYEITDKGRQYFSYLTAEILKEKYEPEFILDGVLFFLEFTDVQQLIQSLEKRESVLKAAIDATERHRKTSLSHVPPDAVFLAKSIFEHHLSHMRAELAWTQSVLKGFDR